MGGPVLVEVAPAVFTTPGTSVTVDGASTGELFSSSEGAIVNIFCYFYSNDELRMIVESWVGVVGERKGSNREYNTYISMNRRADIRSRHLAIWRIERRPRSYPGLG